MMPNPWMIIGVIFVVLGTYKYGTYSGYKERDQEMQAEIARLNDESRQKEQKLSQDLNNTSSQLLEANNAISQKQSALDRAISSGRVRFPTSSCVQAATNAATSSGNQTEASESERETLRLIAQLTAEGDKAINELNACIAVYNQVREAINGTR